MLRGIDHVVILVPELDAAVETYMRLGFTVVPGGRHDVATHNALIGFADGAYIELIAFWENSPEHRWHRYLALGCGLVDYCMRTDDLSGDAAALRKKGVAMSERQPMSRVRPDGHRLEWSLSLATRTQGITPFLIEDITPREERLPRQTTHENGVTGILALTIAVQNLATVRPLASLLGAGQPLESSGGEPSGLCYVNRSHRLEFVRPGKGGAMPHWLSSRGLGGVFSLALKTTGEPAAINPRQALDARLSLVRA
jgi:catechol 2,3-dioxygenase-like lactoylglutathione lyase family enzyme